ncbi:MAG: beta-lactamase family protein [Saprospiraceae bacterium]|nr:beta-lactamase family protein [Saprospiraceae bacterium]
MKVNTIVSIIAFFCYGATATGQNYADSLTEELTKLIKRSDLPGFAVALVNSEGIVYQEGFGYADRHTQNPFTPETIINVGSVSKTVVGVAVIKAIEDGALTMDSAINDILPFEIVNPYHKNVPILVRHLITHSSTILDTRYYGHTYVPMVKEFNVSDEPSDSFLKFIREHEEIRMMDFLEKILSKDGHWYKQRNFLNAKPGALMRYSNLNAAVTALVLEKTTHYPFAAYTQQRIFDTLAMSSTGWSMTEIDMNKYATLYFPNGDIVPRYKLITYPEGGLLSNVKDLSRFLKEIILVSEGKSEFLNQTYGELLLPGDEDLDWAFWGLDSGRNIGQSGSDPGIQADLQFNADTKIGRIILCNVNAEEDEALFRDYREIKAILSKYEKKIGSIAIMH